MHDRRSPNALLFAAALLAACCLLVLGRAAAGPPPTPPAEGPPGETPGAPPPADPPPAEPPAAGAPPGEPAAAPAPPRIIRVVCTDRICGGCDGRCHKNSGHVAVDKKGHCACTPAEGGPLDRATREAYARRTPE
jgi:hypothetical protein